MTSPDSDQSERCGCRGYLKTEMCEVREVLQRCDPALLDPCGDSEQPDYAEAARTVLHLTDGRRVQKVLWRQLFVLDSMVSLLEGLGSVQQLLTLPCPPQPEGGARARWKALKVEGRVEEEQVEELLRSLQDRIHQIHNRRYTLTQLLQQLHSKKQQCDQLGESLLKAQNALQVCEGQLSQLEAESEAALGVLIGWQRLREELQVLVSATQDVMQVHLLSFNQSEVCMELRPHPSRSDNASSNEVQPLRLSVTWSHDDRFTLQVLGSAAGVVEDHLSGRRGELSSSLLKVVQDYVGQWDLLVEIQALRSSFPIDWCPAERQLIYLKAAALVCRLQVEEGYPSSGGVQLLSVSRNGTKLDLSGLKPPGSDPRLTDWLVFLCSSSLI